MSKSIDTIWQNGFTDEMALTEPKFEIYITENQIT